MNIMHDKLNCDILLNFIKSRQSIRKFKNEPIKKEIIEKILECGRYAPSGLNNQPWKVLIIQDNELKFKLSELTHYESIIRNAPVNIAVFYDIERGYNRVKDILAIGAFIENIILAVHALNLGAVWLGEILNQKEKVNELFGLDENKFELMAVIAMGKPDEKLKELSDRERREISEFCQWR